MKKIEIFDSEKAITDNDINEFETKFNITLPENYKKFLKKYNGGYLRDDEERDYLRSLNPLKYGKGTIEFTYQIYCISEPLLEKEFLPIGKSYTDNPVTLCLKEGEHYGKIILFFFDRDEDPGLAADTLEELLGVESIDDL